MAGSNDVGILMGILLLLVLMGGIVPIVQNAVGRVSTSYDTDPIAVANPEDSPESYYNSSSLVTDPGYFNALGIVESMGRAFFWVFEDFPWYLTLIHIVIRVIGGVLLYRLIRSGGG